MPIVSVAIVSMLCCFHVILGNFMFNPSLVA